MGFSKRQSARPPGSGNRRPGCRNAAGGK
ncbi:hypothetical protein RHECNPAF_1360057 [Rhizobium etli CNPAF512]|nr:hypothetical protein RHECNPAF_1360057 [Rhizobium etli CNPAF512]